MNQDKTTDKRKNAIKRIGLAAGASALAIAAGTSMLSALTACSGRQNDDTDKVSAPPAAYSNTFPVSQTPDSVAKPNVEKPVAQTTTNGKKENTTKPVPVKPIVEPTPTPVPPPQPQYKNIYTDA